MNRRFAALLLLVPTFTFAQSTPLINGAGGIECPKYLELRADKTGSVALTFGSWMQGFASGFNVSMSTSCKRYKRLPSATEMLNFADGYCRTNPAKFVIDASTELYMQLPWGK